MPPSMDKPGPVILVADIGATNSRFALYQTGDHGGLSDEFSLPTAAHTSFPQLLESAAASLPLALHRADLAVLAVAGPVLNQAYCQPPNMDYAVDLSVLPPGILPRHSVLINDFTAQALGCRSLEPEGLLSVLPGEMDPAQIQAVIGAGTGLGKAGLAPDGRDGARVINSEGGHASFPFVSRDELEFMEFVLKATGLPYAQWETVVSGSGLALIHQFHTGEKAEPAQAAAALTEDGPVAAWFARFYARACRDWALATVAAGGVFISGGVAGKNPILATHPEFAREFRLATNMKDFLKGVAVKLVRDQAVGLKGAAAHGLALLGQ